MLKDDKEITAKSSAKPDFAAPAAKRLLFLLLALLLALSFFWSAGLVKSQGRFFSADQSYRIQTDRILDGHVSLMNDPTGLRNDWAWNGESAQQVWGLGVPLLRLPFEAAARVFGRTGFPDRLVLLLIVTAAAAAVLKAACRLTGPAEKFSAISLSLIISVVVFSDPLLFGAAHSRMRVYEEAAFCLAAWNFIVWSVLLAQVGNRTSKSFFLLAFLAGSSVWIRPTGAFYGFTAMVLLSLLVVSDRSAWRSGMYLVCGGWLVFAAVIGSCLLLNYFRFGSPIEFGHSINITLPHNGFALRFGTALGRVPLTDAVSELTEGLFSCSPFQARGFFDKSPCGTKLNPFRFREYYFTAYSTVEKVIFLLGLAFTIAAAGLKRLRPQAFNAAGISIVWGTCSTLMLGIFYLYSSSVASRYFLDFVPGIAAITAGLLAIAGRGINFFDFLKNRITLRRRLYAALFLLAAVLLIELRVSEVAAIRVAEGYGPAVTLDFSETMAATAKIRSRWRENIALPAKISCPAHETETNSASPSGWKFNDSCSLAVMTSVIMPSADCIVLAVENQRSAKRLGWRGPIQAIDKIRVKRGLTELHEVRNETFDNEIVLHFCADPPPKREKFSIFSIRWEEPDVRYLRSPKYKLHSIAVEQSGIQ